MLQCDGHPTALGEAIATFGRIFKSLHILACFPTWPPAPSTTCAIRTVPKMTTRSDRHPSGRASITLHDSGGLRRIPLTEAGSQRSSWSTARVGRPG
ncbi:hypothetical protein ACTWPT_16845 [Nonomuraea sp. 3N208]|uniref:hypothetical protein n=1 Tax=Nonomuraea sp. 3N208 TaxID=3457421 RepID=UPI003FCDFACA